MDELREQLAFARQKASLYYIAMSELESLRRVSSNRTLELREVGTNTDVKPDSAGSGISEETQTFVSSDLVELERVAGQLSALQTELENCERSEMKRVELLHRLETIIDQPSQLAEAYAELLREHFLNSHMAVRQSVELRRRDAMIGSLLDKIKLMEELFGGQAARVAREARVAQPENTVSVDIKIQHGRSNHIEAEEATPSLTWQDMAAMHSELEDMRAELSKARSNWAATRDELVRLQFRVGSDGNHGKTASEFPGPILALTESAPAGLISSIRKLR